VIALIFFVLLKATALLVPHIGLVEGLSEPVVEYLKISSWSIFGVCLYFALKEFLQAYEIVIFPNVLSILGIFVNFAICWVLTFGLGPIPAFGIAGLAFGALITRTLEGAVLLVYCIPFIKGKSEKGHSYVKDLLKTGYPMALALFIEFLGFNITAVLVGKFSTVYAAAHNIILTILGVAYMLPLSLLNATAIKIGYANGERNLADIKRYYFAALALATVLAFLTILVYLFFAPQLIGIFTQDAEVIAAALSVVLLVVCFTFFDGFQCAASGALRGLKKTKPIMLAVTISYMLIGLPIGCILAFKYGIVLVGFWVGITTAVIVASIASTVILVREIKKYEN
jgi:MATE family multidrug resistance protein